ncbi:MAG: hypothetical protein ACI3ZP_03085, partial [Candidatus Cryptobacteroides sp.]
TQDPQLRRLLLYPAELPNHHYLRNEAARREADCKYSNNLNNVNDYCQVIRIFQNKIVSSS